MGKIKSYEDLFVFQIKFSKRIGYLKEKKVIDELVERTTEIGKMLNSLIGKLKTSN